MNSPKSAFGITSGKFVGFIAQCMSIKIEQGKIKVIQDIFPLKNLKELQVLQGHLA